MCSAPAIYVFTHLSHLRYLYQLFIVLDANFHLNNQLRHRNHLKKDRPLYDGLGYQVPQKAYYEYLKKCVTEDDVSIYVDDVHSAHIFDRSVPVLPLQP